MSKVFVIQHPIPNHAGWTPDLGPAAQYGALHYIFDVDDKVYVDPNSAKTKLISRLKDFNPEEDFLCWHNAGDPAAVWLTIQVLASGGVKKIKYLYWQKPRKHSGQSGGHYLPIILDSSIGAR